MPPEQEALLILTRQQFPELEGVDCVVEPILKGGSDRHYYRFEWAGEKHDPMVLMVYTLARRDNPKFVPATRRLAPAFALAGLLAAGGALAQDGMLRAVLLEAGAVVAEVHLEGPSPYSLTGELMAWAAQQLAAGAGKSAGVVGPVEAFGLDENWIDVTAGSRSFPEAVRVADEIRRRVLDELPGQ